jgi:AmiR/NasT family two-component response regulator
MIQYARASHPAEGVCRKAQNGRRGMQERAATTVVLADDHAIVREGIAALCAANGIRVLGQVADGGAAVEMIAALNPDFAILDQHTPGGHRD